MSVHRLSLAALAFLFSFGSAVGQEPSRLLPLDPVSNWPAPPYWMPSIEVLPGKPAKESLTIPLNNIVGISAGTRVSPETVEAVPTAPLAFIGIPPCRVADTRGNGFSGQYGPPQLTPAGRTITIINTCSIPAAAQAVSFNFSAVNVSGAGFLVAYPAGGAFPPVATMTYNQNTPNLSNAAVVPLGTGGAITVVAAVVSIDLVIDVNGYYAPQTVVNTVNGLSGAVTLAQGSNITITPSGQTLTIASTGGGAAGWSLTGNAGTTPGTNFLGTTDSQALELKVDGQRTLRLEPHGTSPNLIGGFSGNSVTNGTFGATIGGGGETGFTNRVTDGYGTVSGGDGNQAGDGAGTTTDRGFATVGGGSANVASGTNATVGGGSSNMATSQFATVGGGFSNMATVTSATIGGGFSNTASGSSSTIPGGNLNLATGTFSFAAGNRAKAIHNGAFVWGDSTAVNVQSSGVNQFIVRAAGGIWLGTTSSPSITIASDFLNTSTGAHLTIGGVWTNNSDRAAKENFEPIDAQEVLSRVAVLPMSKWSYKAEDDSVRHIGPMAQDFSAAFGLGGNDRSIATVDADGVALVAIQALYELVKEKECEIETLRGRLAKLEARVE